ncbi:hypothetical protein ACLS0R_17705 [Comamonas jiangduensis]|uniref:hypothetical protein n=1 Tax=Comamonas jiangduensis TaxID=1194168 RepID=UPI003BF8AF39
MTNTPDIWMLHTTNPREGESQWGGCYIVEADAHNDAATMRKVTGLDWEVVPMVRADSLGKCLHQIAEPATVQAAPSEVMGALRALHDSVELAIQRGALSERALEIIIMQPATDVLMRAAAQQAVQAAVPKWIDDPHDIEQGQMLNPEWLKLQQSDAPAHPAEGVPALAVLDGGTPGPWRVRKRTNDVGEVLDCFVTAPDCQGRAYDAHILGDDYDSIDLKLADAELVVAAVNAFRAAATHPTKQGLDAQMLDFINDKRVALTPEYEGPWKAEVFSDEDAPVITVEGKSVRDAVSAALAAQAKQGEQANG